MSLSCIVILNYFYAKMCSYLFDSESSIDEDMSEETPAPQIYVKTGLSSQDFHPDQSLEGSQNVNDSQMNDCSSENSVETDDVDNLGVEDNEVVRDNVHLVDEAVEKMASASEEIEKQHLKGVAMSYLREKFVACLLSVVEMKAHWDTDESFEKWYAQAHDLVAEDPSLHLDTAMRIVLKKHKEMLHKQLQDAIENVGESSESSESQY